MKVMAQIVRYVLAAYGAIVIVEKVSKMLEIVK